MFSKSAHRALGLFAITVLIALISSTPNRISWAQFQIDSRIIGDWVKAGTGDMLEVRSDGSVFLSLGGQVASFSGAGSIERCIESGANICISGSRFKCAYRYAFSEGGIMNFQFTEGEPISACNALAGDFRRQDGSSLPGKAITTILTACHRRALFTRMHFEMSFDSMFSTIAKCRQTIDSEIQNIQDKKLQEEAMNLLAAVEGIERLRGQPDVDLINKWKLAALHSFRLLAEATGGSYPLPKAGELAVGFYFTQEESDAPLDTKDLMRQIPIDPDTGAVRH